jgi:hypothetical protein
MVVRVGVTDALPERTCSAKSCVEGDREGGSKLDMAR